MYSIVFNENGKEVEGCVAFTSDNYEVLIKTNNSLKLYEDVFGKKVSELPRRSDDELDDLYRQVKEALYDPYCPVDNDTVHCHFENKLNVRELIEFTIMPYMLALKHYQKMVRIGNLMVMSVQI